MSRLLICRLQVLELLLALRIGEIALISFCHRKKKSEEEEEEEGAKPVNKDHVIKPWLHTCFRALIFACRPPSRLRSAPALSLLSTSDLLNSPDSIDFT
jgi:hypothetical protein